MMAKLIAAIGDRDSVMLFQAVGIKTFYATTELEASKIVHKLARDGYAVIYITEPVAALIPEVLERYKTDAFPAIIPIPNRFGSTGFGMKSIRKNIEKAIGADIL